MYPRKKDLAASHTVPVRVFRTREIAFHYFRINAPALGSCRGKGRLPPSAAESPSRQRHEGSGSPACVVGTFPTGDQVRLEAKAAKGISDAAKQAVVVATP